jgi:hypothetical protein
VSSVPQPQPHFIRGPGGRPRLSFRLPPSAHVVEGGRPLRAYREVRTHIDPVSWAPQPQPHFISGPRGRPMRLNVGSCSNFLTRTELDRIGVLGLHLFLASSLSEPVPRLAHSRVAENYRPMLRVRGCGPFAQRRVTCRPCRFHRHRKRSRNGVAKLAKVKRKRRFRKAVYLRNHQLWFVRTSLQLSAGESTTPFQVSPFPQRRSPDHTFPAGVKLPETNPSVRLMVNRSPSA